MPDRAPQKPYAIIPRKQAMVLIPICLSIGGFAEWLTSYGQWWEGAFAWPPLIMAGALIVRCWPLLLLSDE